MTATLEKPDVVETPLDESLLTHIINCPDDKKSAEAWLTEARVFGLEVEALCGFRWVPQRNPDKHPVCRPCVDAAGIIMVEEFGR